MSFDGFSVPDDSRPIAKASRQPSLDASPVGENPTVDKSSNASPVKQKHQESIGGLYFLLSTASLMIGAWFVGPRMVEEYHFAAARGQARAQYTDAVHQLNEAPLNSVSQAYRMVAQKVRPSVVSVSAVKSARESSGLGSGVIMSTDGYIMTNAHVVDGASRFLVELHDRRRYEASLVGVDPVSDLALLKINAPRLIAADWGNSDEAEVGSIVWAVGSPYGFQQTVTSGIISGKDRPGDGLQGKQTLLQTDAAVNPGNSGGPLVDDRGRVIGINTSIYGETFQGISFAVPSGTAMFVYDELKRNGSVTRGYLGVYPAEVDFRDAEQLNLPDLDGAKLRSVLYNSPADRAGIQANDIIRSWNGVVVKEFNHLFRLTEMTPPNSKVAVTLLRNGEEKQAEVTLGEAPRLQRP